MCSFLSSKGLQQAKETPSRITNNQHKHPQDLKAQHRLNRLQKRSNLHPSNRTYQIRLWMDRKRESLIEDDSKLLCTYQPKSQEESNTQADLERSTQWKLLCGTVPSKPYPIKDRHWCVDYQDSLCT